MSALVLITDGDPRRLERVRRRIEAEGPDTVAAHDVREAMAHFVHREPDLTVIHADSPGDLGMELCRDLKRLGAGRRRPVVIVAPRASRSAAFDAGCDMFVARLLDRRSLQRLVRCFLVSHRRPRPIAAIALSP